MGKKCVTFKGRIIPNGDGSMDDILRDIKYADLFPNVDITSDEDVNTPSLFELKRGSKD
jgi:hypothetical protein